MSFGANPPPFNELGLDRIKRMVDRAEKFDINIAFENLRRPDYLEHIFTRIDSPYAGFCYDSGHENLFPARFDLLTEYGSRLSALHLHDNNGLRNYDGTDDQHLIPFDGNIDWKNIVEKIRKTPYKGPVSLEVMNRGRENLKPEEFLRLLYERGERLREWFNS